jgi:hypothetical protein
MTDPGHLVPAPNLTSMSAIDPALFSPFDSKDSAQPYAAQPQQQVGHPYYLPPSAAHQHQHQHPQQHQHHRPELSQPPALGSSTHAALQQTSPHVSEGFHDEYELEQDQDDDGDHDHDHDGTHATPGSAKDAADFKRPRACDSCRGLKVRCDQERPDVSCKRCAKAGRPW